MFNLDKNYKIILASKSPRRALILKQLGLNFEIVESRAEEESFEGNCLIAEFVVKMSLKKSSEVAERIPRGIVIGADTVVSIDGDILGKPKDRNDAINMLKKLSGKTHTVYTGVCVILNPDNIKKCDFEVTKVKFRDLDENEIIYYIDSCGVMDKAGSYGIQDFAATFVERINGCYSNVVGLPITKVYLLLNSLIK